MNKYGKQYPTTAANEYLVQVKSGWVYVVAFPDGIRIRQTGTVPITDTPIIDDEKIKKEWIVGCIGRKPLNYMQRTRNWNETRLRYAKNRIAEWHPKKPKFKSEFLRQRDELRKDSTRHRKHRLIPDESISQYVEVGLSYSDAMLNFDQIKDLPADWMEQTYINAVAHRWWDE